MPAERPPWPCQGIPCLSFRPRWAELSEAAGRDGCRCGAARGAELGPAGGRPRHNLPAHGDRHRLQPPHRRPEAGREARRARRGDRRRGPDPAARRQGGARPRAGALRRRGRRDRDGRVARGGRALPRRVPPAGARHGLPLDPDPQARPRRLREPDAPRAGGEEARADRQQDLLDRRRALRDPLRRAARAAQEVRRRRRVALRATFRGPGASSDASHSRAGRAAVASSSMTVQLDDGSELLIRPILPADKARLAAGLTRLSETSIQRRFLGPKPRLTRAELRYLTEVDGRAHYAIVAVDPRTGDVVAVGRWVRLVSDPLDAEAAIVVCDALQGKGLGKELARRLADAARERGIRRIHATMLSDTPPAHALMRIIAERLTGGVHDHGVHEVVAELAA